MRFLKTNPFLGLLNSYLIDAPQPANISYMWNFGSLLGLCLVIQIATGVTLAMHYTPNVDLAFISVEHIIRDVNFGWFIRYTHANTASFFFIFLYAHVGRGLYYGSYRWPRSLPWIVGVIILVLTIATAFLGYILAQNDINITNKTYKYNKQNINNKFKPYLIQKRYNSNITNIQENSIKEKEYPLLKEFLNENELYPKYIYINLHLDSTRNIIKNDLINLSGIYLIYNLVTNDYYIGSASTNCFYKRFSNHLIYFNGSKILKSAVIKYKIYNFSFIILELFPYTVNKENNKNLLDLEDIYLKTLLPNYNILTEAGNSFGYKHTQMDRLKIKINYSIKRREFISNLNLDKKFSELTIQRIKDSALNRKDAVYTETSLLNIKINSKPIRLYNLDKTIYGEYSSIVETAKSINCSVKTITRALKSDSKKLKRRFFVYYI